MTDTDFDQRLIDYSDEYEKEKDNETQDENN